MLVQLHIQSTDFDIPHNVTIKNFPVNLQYQRCKLKVLNIQYETDAVTPAEVVYITSTRFNTSHNNIPQTVMFSTGSSSQKYITGEPLEFETSIYGYIDISLFKATGGAPTNFSYLLLTMDIEPIC